MTQSKWWLAALMTVPLMLAGCGGGDDDDGDDNDGSPPAIPLSTMLSGNQEVPPVTTTGSGSADLAIAGDRSQLDVTLVYQQIVNVTQAHIHVGETGTNGSIIFFLCSNLNSAPDGVQSCPGAGGTVMTTLTADDLSAQPGAEDFETALQAIQFGNTYVNVHTAANSGGELRGQVGTVDVVTSLSGGQEVPSVTSDASGAAMVTVDQTASTIDYTLTYGNITAVQQAHIHVGEVGTNGSIVLFLCSNLGSGSANTPLCPADGGTVTGSLTIDDLIGVDFSFAQVIDAILSGTAYVNVHTEANTGGEIRGQLGAVQLMFALTGDQEVPAVITTATGTGSARLNASQTAISYRLTYSDITDVQQAHVHVGEAGVNGSIVLFLCSNLEGAPDSVPACPAAGDTVAGTLTADDLTSDDFTFTQVVAAMLEGGAYFNVHTMANPGGEIRGQTVDASMP